MNIWHRNTKVLEIKTLKKFRKDFPLFIKQRIKKEQQILAQKQILLNSKKEEQISTKILK